MAQITAELQRARERSDIVEQAHSLSRPSGNIHTTDPLTHAAVAAFVVLTGALACWLPARRAATLDPMEVLRTDG